MHQQGAMSAYWNDSHLLTIHTGKTDIRLAMVVRDIAAMAWHVSLMRAYNEKKERE